LMSGRWKLPCGGDGRGDKLDTVLVGAQGTGVEGSNCTLLVLLLPNNGLCPEI